MTALAEAGARDVVAQGEVMSWLTVLALMGASLVGGFAAQSLRAAERLVPRLAVRDGGARRDGAHSRPRAGADPGGRAGHHRDDIGTQYKHEFLTKLLRLLLASLVTVPFALVTPALVAALYSAVLGLPVTTLVLALAPAGIAEMALTGKILGLTPR